MEWMKDRIRISLRWNEGQEGIWHVLGIPDELRDHDQDDSGIWICLIATRVASILRNQPNLSLQNRNLRLTHAKESVIMEGRKVITKSIQYGKIRSPNSGPFCYLWIESGKREGHRMQKRKEIKVRKHDSG